MNKQIVCKLPEVKKQNSNSHLGLLFRKTAKSYSPKAITELEDIPQWFSQSQQLDLSSQDDNSFRHKVTTFKVAEYHFQLWRKYCEIQMSGCIVLRMHY